jgi:hypothetical protein
MMEAIRSSETSVLIRATRRHITEDGILHHCHENLKSYKKYLPLCLGIKEVWGGTGVEIHVFMSSASVAGEW